MKVNISRTVKNMIDEIKQVTEGAITYDSVVEEAVKHYYEEVIPFPYSNTNA